jgi:hypothetical protein
MSNDLVSLYTSVAPRPCATVPLDLLSYRYLGTYSETRGRHSDEPGFWVPSDVHARDLTHRRSSFDQIPVQSRRDAGR